MASPVLSSNQNFQSPGTRKKSYLAPTSDGSVMTFENTMQKTVITFTVLIAAAAIGWFFPILALPAVVIGFVLGLVNSFKKEPSPPLILAYAVFEGLAVGGLSSLMEQEESGIVSQAVLATLCVVASVLFLYKSGKVRATPKMTRFFMIATMGYLLFSVVNFMLMVTGVVRDPWGLRSSVMIPHTDIPLGVALGIFAVLLGAYSLILDFTFLDQGVANQLPEKYGWTAAFGIVVTVVWIYIEILRLMRFLRR